MIISTTWTSEERLELISELSAKGVSTYNGVPLVSDCRALLEIINYVSRMDASALEELRAEIFREL